MRSTFACALIVTLCVYVAGAQQTKARSLEPSKNLQRRVKALETEVNELKQIVKQLQAESSHNDKQSVGTQPAFDSAETSNPIELGPKSGGPSMAANARRVSLTALPSRVTGVAAAAPVASQTPSGTVGSGINPEDRKTLDFLRATTLNVAIDTYYEYNFNDPVGRVNLLRAYDVLSNEFSLNQADVVAEHAPDVSARRRWGGRLDLQFGQATDTLQGNPANEPRPEIYRNVFQAYGSYVLPFDKGVQVDFGKWSSSLGIEGNYTKDQMNYSRSYWFMFLPYYHMGLRTSIPIGERGSVNYWVVNGTNQVEATNGYKDELWGFTAKPAKSLTWTLNYYLGQEHPDRAVTTNCGPIPVQPGLCFTAIRPAPNGHTDIFDSYATWQATKKLTFAIEGDYFIQRLWQRAAPGESSAPSRVDGGAAYVQYRFNAKFALATRAEYMSDGGLFSGLTQSLKENTVTFDYKPADTFLMRFEWRRDYSNQPTFLSDVQGVLRKNQTTATLGLVWWWGRKEGAW
jgi:Putative beta-barrel porin-2, OmpL-like. bbp2